jgi:pSer/pThr/pTyr-binding forkhead associated (FHA) protein
LGRGHECDVRISDISVSRKHAFIKFKDGNFVITDNNSKFGTLIKMKTPIPVTQDKVAI